MKNVKKKIMKLSELIYENSNKIKKERSFPVAGIFWSNNLGVIGAEINQKSETGIGNHAFHAESLLVENINEEAIGDKTIKAIIVLPPCDKCFKKILNTNKSWRIFYLTDSIRNKMNKDYLKKDNIKIEKLTNKKYYDLETRLYINYLIYKVNRVALTHHGLKPEEKMSMEKEIEKQLEKSKDVITKSQNRDNSYLFTKISKYFMKKLDRKAKE